MRRKPKSATAAPALVKVTKALHPTAFGAWLRHLRQTGQTFAASHWEKAGHVYASSHFPPVEQPSTPGDRNAVR